MPYISIQVIADRLNSERLTAIYPPHCFRWPATVSRSFAVNLYNPFAHMYVPNILSKRRYLEGENYNASFLLCYHNISTRCRSLLF